MKRSGSVCYGQLSVYLTESPSHKGVALHEILSMGVENVLFITTQHETTLIGGGVTPKLNFLVGFVQISYVTLVGRGWIIIHQYACWSQTGLRFIPVRQGAPVYVISRLSMVKLSCRNLNGIFVKKNRDMVL